MSQAFLYKTNRFLLILLSINYNLLYIFMINTFLELSIITVFNLLSTFILQNVLMHITYI